MVESIYMPSVEVLSFYDKCEIRLFKYNRQWGYSVSIDTYSEGWGFGSFLKFCDPYLSRQLAIGAAVRRIRVKITDSRDCNVLKSLNVLLQPTLL